VDTAPPPRDFWRVCDSCVGTAYALSAETVAPEKQRSPNAVSKCCTKYVGTSTSGSLSCEHLKQLHKNLGSEQRDAAPRYSQPRKVPNAGEGSSHKLLPAAKTRNDAGEQPTKGSSHTDRHISEPQQANISGRSRRLYKSETKAGPSPRVHPPMRRRSAERTNSRRWPYGPISKVETG